MTTPAAPSASRVRLAAPPPASARALPGASDMTARFALRRTAAHRLASRLARAGALAVLVPLALVASAQAQTTHISRVAGSGAFDAQHLVFDGIDDYVSVPHKAAHALTNAVTLEAWVKPAAFVTNAGIVTKGVEQRPWTLVTLGDGRLEVGTQLQRRRGLGASERAVHGPAHARRLAACGGGHRRWLHALLHQRRARGRDGPRGGHLRRDHRADRHRSGPARRRRVLQGRHRRGARLEHRAHRRRNRRQPHDRLRPDDGGPRRLLGFRRARRPRRRRRGRQRRARPLVGERPWRRRRRHHARDGMGDDGNVRSLRGPRRARVDARALADRALSGSPRRPPPRHALGERHDLHRPRGRRRARLPVLRLAAGRPDDDEPRLRAGPPPVHRPDERRRQRRPLHRQDPHHLDRPLGRQHRLPRLPRRSARRHRRRHRQLRRHRDGGPHAGHALRVLRRAHSGRWRGRTGVRQRHARLGAAPSDRRGDEGHAAECDAHHVDSACGRRSDDGHSAGRDLPAHARRTGADGRLRHVHVPRPRQHRRPRETRGGYDLHLLRDPAVARRPRERSRLRHRRLRHAPGAERRGGVGLDARRPRRRALVERRGGLGRWRARDAQRRLRPRLRRRRRQRSGAQPHADVPAVQRRGVDEGGDPDGERRLHPDRLQGPLRQGIVTGELGRVCPHDPRVEWRTWGRALRVGHVPDLRVRRHRLAPRRRDLRRHHGAAVRGRRAETVVRGHARAEQRAGHDGARKVARIGDRREVQGRDSTRCASGAPRARRRRSAPA